MVNVDKHTNLLTSILTAVMIGGLLLIAFYYLAMEVGVEFDNVENDTRYEDVELPGISMFESLGPLIYVFGGIIAVLVAVLVGVTGALDDR